MRFFENRLSDASSDFGKIRNSFEQFQVAKIYKILREPIGRVREDWLVLLKYIIITII